MKSTKLLSCAAVLALTLGAARAEEYSLTAESLRMGPRAPRVEPGADGPTLVFTADATDGDAAEIAVRKFDFSHGARITLEFQAERPQSNSYPRLLDTGIVILHLINDNIGNLRVKALVNGPDRQAAEIIEPLPERPGVWRRLEFEFDPAAESFALRLDDGERRAAPLPFKPSVLRDLAVRLGSNAQTKTARGLNGRLRALRIVTPFVMADGAAVKPEDLSKPLAHNGAPLEHFTVSYVKNRHLAFPGVARAANGDLVATFREGEAHVDPYGRICVARSVDGGKNWSAPVCVVDTASDLRDPSVQLLPDGRLLLTHGGWNSWMANPVYANTWPGETAYINQTGPKKYGGSHYLWSSDHGVTWTGSTRVPPFNPHGPAIDGDGCYFHSAVGNDNNRRQIHIYRSGPDGASWERLAKIGESPMGPERFEEPHTAILANGTMVTAIRVESDGYMRISHSADRGRTWTEPVKTPVKGYPQHLLPLKDGRLLATYGYRYYPYGVRACLSTDGGRTWDVAKEIVLQNNGANGDLGYPVSVELDGGEVLTVYYHNRRDLPNAHIIEAVRFKP